jgi:hypothetical protein
MRNVQAIYPADKVMLGKTEILQALPLKHINQVSPFLLLHHFKKSNIPPGKVEFDVAPHPHRGFEPVTFLFEGGIHHRDSMGNEGFLTDGDVQWMTAGRGVIHSESATKEFQHTGGNLHGVQLWVNLPKANKMAEPNYQDIKSETIPVYISSDEKIKLRVVAGEWNLIKGPAKTFTEILAMHGRINKDKQDDIHIPAQHNAILYVLDGKLEINGKHHAHEGMIIFYKNDGAFISIKAREDTQFLLLSGTPIHEPLATYGPFVMNTQTEVMEAIRDYQMGKMGLLTY